MATSVSSGSLPGVASHNSGNSQGQQQQQSPLSTPPGSVRRDNTLFIRIVEGRQLRNGAATDAYCAIRVDDAKNLVRTQTQFGTKTPFWGEEYHFEVFPNFQEMCVVAFDASGNPISTSSDSGINTSGSQNESEISRSSSGVAIGKVCVSSIALRRKQEEVEQWFPLTRMEDYFSSGKVMVEVIKCKSKNGIDVDVNLLELRSKDGAIPFSHANTYMEIALFRNESRVSQKLRTPTTQYLPSTLIGEMFNFHIDEDGELEVRIFLYRYHRWRPNTLLGYTIVPLSQIPLKIPHVCFYDFEPKSRRPSQDDGFLKIKYKFTEEYILPLSEYEELSNLLLEENLAVIRALGKFSTDREDVARTLLRIFEGKNCTTKYVKSLYLLDIASTLEANDVNLLFRGNSIGTKTIEMYMKLVGSNYLVQVLKPLVKSIYDSKQSCEVDPLKMEKGEDLKANQEQLRKHLSYSLELIYGSTDRCPIRFKELFYDMRKTVSQHFKEDKVPLHAVSGFLFLRFFCPAILSPKIFKLHDDHPNKDAKRALILVAKQLQRIASFAEATMKEDYLRETEQNVESQREGMYRFIDAISTIPEELPQRIGLAVDIEREFAGIHRHMNRCRDKLEKYEVSRGKDASIAALFPILDKLDSIRSSRVEKFELDRKGADEKENSRPRLRSMYTTTPNNNSPAISPERSRSASLLQMDKLEPAAEASE